MNCEECRYWKRPDSKNMRDEGDGHCRRYPPKLDPNYYKEYQHSATEESSWYGHPITNKDDWCGEYYPR